VSVTWMVPLVGVLNIPSFATSENPIVLPVQDLCS
jgi:hypothetical protein